jgi:hypothetical protein
VFTRFPILRLCVTFHNKLVPSGEKLFPYSTPKMEDLRSDILRGLNMGFIEPTLRATGTSFLSKYKYISDGVHHISQSSI